MRELEEILRSHALWLDRERAGRRADLRFYDLSGASLGGRRLARASLVGARLVGCDLRNADLVGCDLFGADLTDADLRGAGLAEADLRGATLQGTRFDHANLNAAARSAPTKVSAEGSRVAVWMIPTNEEAVIAKETAHVLAGS